MPRIFQSKLFNHQSHNNHTKIYRQWGTEKDITPLSYLHSKPSTQTIALSRFSIVLTVIFWFLYVISVVFKQLFEGPHSYQFTLEAFGYLAVVTFLTFSALLYLIARQGALQRFAHHIRIPRAILEKHFATKQSSITVLIPSYAEEPQVVRKTILSAALQEYQNLNIVLLVDDNPNPIDKNQKIKLQQTRNLHLEINKLLSKPKNRFSTALKNFNLTYKRKKLVSNETIKNLSKEYKWASEWLEKFCQLEKIEDHVDVFFTQHLIMDLSKELKLVQMALDQSYLEKAKLSKDRVQQLYQRLVSIFSAKISVFERKQYASLSHEPNKAMNLNAYIGLMGNAYIKEETPDGVVLIPTLNKKKADLIIPDSDYLLTLDADSILLKEYCLRLVYFLEQKENADVAVTQTPYSSFRGAPSRIERLSGATTDIQHILHQGMSYYNATFWVGANAVIRKKALEDIVKTETVGGFEIKKYIQDFTVIEDTESSIDLGLKGWKLVNYPERLSYSATPPDFGSLIVQRRRWANGGLLILPKLWELRQFRKRNNKPNSLVETFLRLNYMASIAWSNFGLVFLLAYPYDGRLLSPLVLLSATPYFLAMASDLKNCRYKYSDILRIYGFNLILLPVNIAGVIKSLEQSLTAKKIPFARTPKVKDRTSAGLVFLISPILIIAFSLFTLWRNIEGENWGNAAFAGFNAFTATWAMLAYIGIKNLIVDISIGLIDLLYVDDNSAESSTKNAPKNNLDWKAVLYHGEAEGKVSPMGNNLILHK